MSQPTSRRGRRRGHPDTRQKILAAARDQFGQHGYDGTTIRGVAAEAGVNAALVLHFFGGKEQLFATTLDLPIDPSTMVATLLDGPLAGLGERMLRLFFTLWRDPDSRAPLLALVRSVSTNEHAAATLRQFIEHALLSTVADTLNVPRLWLSTMASHVIGIAVMRYIVQLEPIASASEDELIALVAPVIQRYTGTG